MLTPSPAEGYSLSPPAARGLKLKKCPASSRRRALELKITITFLLCNKYPHEYKKQELPVSDTETDSFLLWYQTDYNMADDDMWIVSRKANSGFKYIYTIKFGGDEDPLPRFCSLVRENLPPH